MDQNLLPELLRLERLGLTPTEIGRVVGEDTQTVRRALHKQHLANERAAAGEWDDYGPLPNIPAFRPKEIPICPEYCKPCGWRINGFHCLLPRCVRYANIDPREKE